MVKEGVNMKNDPKDPKDLEAIEVVADDPEVYEEKESEAH